MEYKRAKMKDKRWTNAIKCDIMATIKDLIEAQNKDRHEGLNEILSEKKQYLHDLGLDVRKNRLLMKEGMNDFKDKILSNTNRILLERYRQTHPDKIKSSMKRSIHQINYGSNILITQINQKKKELQLLSSSNKFQHKKTINYSNFRRIMRDSANLDDRIQLASFSKKKMKRMVNLAQQHLNKYDPLLKKLHKDREEMADNLMNEIELGVKFKSDTNKYTKELKNEILASQKQRIKQMGEIEQLNFILDSMDRSRKTLMMERPDTELEVAFKLALPYATDDPIQPSEEIITNSSDEDKTEWFHKMSEFGVNYFIDQDEKNQLLSKLENEDNTSSTINYKFPADIEDYIYFHDLSQTKDDIALNYFRIKLKFKTIKELINFVERTKYDLIKMNALKAIRQTLWKLVIKENDHLQDSIENCNLITNEEMEFHKRENILKSFIDKQHKKISELKESRKHYLRLFNDIGFYMDNLRSILQTLNFSDVHIKPGLDSKDKELDIPDVELTQLIKRVDALVNQINVKVKCCTAMFSSNFTTEQINISRAVYIFKVQKHIQENILKKQMELKMKQLKNAKEISMPPKIILSREETKKRAELLLKYIAEKDMDKSKNKRKPISFRRSFI